MIINHKNIIDNISLERGVPDLFTPVIKNRLTGSEFPLNILKSQQFSPKSFNLLLDIPDFLDIPIRKNALLGLKFKEVKQYKGYLIDLTNFLDSSDFFNRSLSKNHRKNFRAKNRNLNQLHNISYQFYFGDIAKPHYDTLFEVCYDLMERRFREKKIHNRNLFKWREYYDLFYPMIMDKKASIFVIYDEETPITITLNFHVGDTVFSHIQVFDTRYSQYSMSDIATFKNIEWCLNNGYKTWDFSKGATRHKIQWSNHIYTFKFLMVYRDNFSNRIRAIITEWLLRWKQIMRDKNVIGGRLQLDGLFYYTKRRKRKHFEWHSSKK